MLHISSLLHTSYNFNTAKFKWKTYISLNKKDCSKSTYLYIYIQNLFSFYIPQHLYALQFNTFEYNFKLILSLLPPTCITDTPSLLSFQNWYVSQMLILPLQHNQQVYFLLGQTSDVYFAAQIILATVTIYLNFFKTFDNLLGSIPSSIF